MAQTEQASGPVAFGASVVKPEGQGSHQDSSEGPPREKVPALQPAAPEGRMHELLEAAPGPSVVVLPGQAEHRGLGSVELPPMEKVPSPHE